MQTIIRVIDLCSEGRRRRSQVGFAYCLVEPEPIPNAQEPATQCGSQTQRRRRECRLVSTAQPWQLTDPPCAVGSVKRRKIKSPSAAQEAAKKVRHAIGVHSYMVKRHRKNGTVSRTIRTTYLSQQVQQGTYCGRLWKRSTLVVCVNHLCCPTGKGIRDLCYVIAKERAVMISPPSQDPGIEPVGRVL